MGVLLVLRGEVPGLVILVVRLVIWQHIAPREVFQAAHAGRQMA
jgi:hypothetical protein